MEREYDQLQEKMSKISKLLRIVALFLILKEFSLALIKLQRQRYEYLFKIYGTVNSKGVLWLDNQFPRRSGATCRAIRKPNLLNIGDL